MDEKYKEIKVLLDFFLRFDGENSVTGHLDGKKCLIMQVTAQLTEKRNAGHPACLLYYSIFDPADFGKVIPVSLSLLGVKKDGKLYLDEECGIPSISELIDETDKYESLSKIELQLSDRKAEIAEEYYNSIDAPATDPEKDHSYLMQSARQVVCFGSSDISASPAIYTPRMTTSMAAAYLCGGDFEGFVREYMGKNATESDLRQEKSLNLAIMHMAEDPVGTGIMWQWELDMINALKKIGDAKTVCVEFSGLEKNGSTKLEVSHLKRRLCYGDKFDLLDFPSQEAGTDLMRELFGTLNVMNLSCFDIISIKYRGKAIYINKEY